MTRGTQNPGSSEAGKRAAIRREAQLAAALRENLRRRKAQTRERKASEETADSADLPDGKER